jgi:hypothetical protein
MIRLSPKGPAFDPSNIGDQALNTWAFGAITDPNHSNLNIEMWLVETEKGMEGKERDESRSMGGYDQLTMYAYREISY